MWIKAIIIDIFIMDGYKIIDKWVKDGGDEADIIREFRFIVIFRGDK